MTTEERKENFKRNISKKNIDELYKIESWLKSNIHSIDFSINENKEAIRLLTWMTETVGDEILDKLLSGE